ncbi:MAG: MarR family transcriptional regulator [Parasphingorhabdus sp.]
MSMDAPKTKKSVAYQARGTFRAFETLMQRRMRDEGLQIAHFDVLRVLWEGDGVTQGYLSEKAFITESTMAQVITQMEKLELIERRLDPADKRKRIIHLLPKGMNIKNKILKITGGFYEKAIAEISEEHLDIYLEVARQLRRNVMVEYDRLYNDKEEK